MTEETTKKPRKDAGKRRALTNLQRREVFKLMEQNGEAHGEWWQYAEGWSDEKIAKTVDCGEGQVASIRRECFGDMKPTPQPGHSPVSVLFAEVKALKERVEKLEKAAKRPANEDHTRLTLTGDRVVGFSVAKPNGA
jgi:hypothetical protein